MTELERLNADAQAKGEALRDLRRTIESAAGDLFMSAESIYHSASYAPTPRFYVYVADMERLSELIAAAARKLNELGAK